MKFLKKILIFIIIFCIYDCYKFSKEDVLESKKQDMEFEVLDEQEEVKEESYNISMIMVGDNLIHSSIYKDAYDGSTYNFTKMYEFIKPIVTNYDIAYYN